jgi:hypothetical protein
VKIAAYRSVQILFASVVGFGLSRPFVAAGGTIRSAYALVRSANNLDLVTGPVRIGIGVTVVSVPMLIGAMLMAVGLGWNRIVSGLAVLVSILGIGSGIASLLVSSSKQIGPMLTLGGGSILLRATIAAVAHQKRLCAQTGADDGLGKMVRMGGTNSG